MQSKKPENTGKLIPTRAELEILQILWEDGPSTVRWVNDKLNELREVNYTTTLKLMQIMTEKGIVLRDESEMKHVYRSAEEENKTKSYMLDNFVNSIYNGSAAKLVMQLLGNKKTARKELEELKELIKNLDRNQ